MRWGFCATVVLLIVKVISAGTLPPPHSPLAAAGISSQPDPGERLRYYSFDEENERNRDKKSNGENSYASKDPFELPSLSLIAEMMRHRESERKYPDNTANKERDREYQMDRPEHRYVANNENSDTGWRRPNYRDYDTTSNREYEGRAGGGSGWPRPLPPPTTAPSISSGRGWDREEQRPHHSGKGSYSPVNRPWQVENNGWGPTTSQRPPYNPQYLASDEDKYKPIRYPPSVTSSLQGSSQGGWSDSGGPQRPLPPLSSSVWESNKPREESNKWDDRPQSGPGKFYLPPHRENAAPKDPQRTYLPPRDPPQSREPPPRNNYPDDRYGPPIRDPPRWPANDNRDRDSYSSGWNSQPSRYNNNDRWETENRRPPQRDEPASSHHHNNGWGWESKRPPAPPPASFGRGWDRDSNNRDSYDRSREEPPRRPNPFEYKPGIDDLTLTRHTSSNDFERSDYPPGISRDNPYSKVESSFEDDSLPKSPNHYRLTAHTPSPEEIHKILYQKPPPGKDENKHDYLPQEREQQDLFAPEPSKCRNSCGNINEKDTEKDRDSDFRKKIVSKISDSSSKTALSDVQSSLIGKTRYDAHGFKYVPHDQSSTIAKRVASPPRDIYSQLDHKRNRDSFKRAIHQQQEKENVHNKESTSESRNVSIRKSLTRSHISLWKSEDHQTKSGALNSNVTITTFPTRITTTSTTTSTPPTNSIRTAIIRSRNFNLKNKSDRNATKNETSATATTNNADKNNLDFGQRLKAYRRERGFKPVSGPFGARSRLATPKIKERDALVSEPDIEIVYAPTNTTGLPPMIADLLDSDATTTSLSPDVTSASTLKI